MNKENEISDSETMLANMDKVMRQLRRRPNNSHHSGRGSYRLLKVISENPGLSTKELSEKMDIRRASLNEKLLRFEERGITIREKDLEDQRVQLVFIKPSGLKYLEKIKEVRSKKKDAISRVLTSEEITELARLSGKLADGLQEIHSESNYDCGKEKRTVYEQ